MLLGAAIVLGLTVPAANSAWASVIYNYTGNNFDQFIDGPPADPVYYTTLDSISASVTFAQSLAPNQTNVNVTGLVTQFAISDGHHTINNTNDSFWSLFVTTDASSQIVYWSMHAAGSGSNPQIDSDSIHAECSRSSQVHRLHLGTKLPVCRL